MGPEGFFLVVASAVLLLGTIAATAINAIRQRDRQQIDLFFAVFTSAFVIFSLKNAIRGTGNDAILFVYLLSLLAQPYLLLRLVRHFRPVPVALRAVVLSCTGLGALVLLALPRPRPASLMLVVTVYFVMGQGYAAWAFAVESRKTAGVTGWRLRLAAIGSSCLPILFIFTALARQYPELQRPAATGVRVFAFAMAACYYFGLATPRFLRRFWQRAEIYRFLEEVAESNPAEREARAATDLSRAASRGVAATATLVLLGKDDLVVRAATNRAWEGLPVVSNAGVIGQARFSLEAMSGTIDDIDPQLAPLLATAGRHIVAVPVTSRRHYWGILLVVQRFGSLFPDDDMELLSRLCRYTADTLNHARLIADERDRQQRVADARVRESEALLRVMIESITDYAMLTLDLDGRVTTWNVGAEQVFGYAAHDILGKPAACLFDERDAPLSMDLLQARLGESVSREGVCKRRDDSTFVGSSVIRTLRHTDQDTEGFVIVTRDVSEQRQLETRVRQGQKMEAVGRLAGGVAHDFNNLLTVILGYAAILEAEAPGNNIPREDIGEIRKAAERAAALTRQLLSFSRQQVLQPRVVELSAIVLGLLPMLTRVLGEQIAIVDELAGDTKPVYCDPSELEQIIINLAVNARDAMPAGGRLTFHSANAWLDNTATATSIDLAPGSYAMLEVRDTGTGMDAATKARVFEPFFTTKEFGRGTGLGLSTVYGLVKQMGGAITVDSELDRGTSFRVYLPHATKAAEISVPATATDQPIGGSETVLLVEDEDSVRALVASVLHRHGYRVMIAENPAVARTLVETHQGPLDLIVTDVVMPGGTGPDLVNTLIQVRPDLRTLYISGYAETALANQGTPDMSRNFLQKPFTGPQLLDKVRQVLS